MRSSVLLLVVAMSSAAAGPPSSPTHAGESSVRGQPGDWVSPESLAAAVYSVVSGPAGKQRDWDRYRALFREGAPFASLLEDGAPITFGVEEYIKWYGPTFLERGIHEREIWGRTERFRHVAHRWSTEEFRWGDTGETPDGRSMVSMQFVHDGTRWWITSMLWQAADDANRIPPGYLPAETADDD